MWSEWLEYDPSSPTGLRNRVTRYGGKDGKSPVAVAGEVSGCIGPDGYCTGSLNNVPFSAHRVVYEMHNGPIPEQAEIDHIDGNRSNNNILNLRLVACVANQRNKKMPSTNTSGVVGVRLFEKTVRSKTYSYWRAFWNDSETGRWTCEDFPIHKLGDKAFDLAVERRCRAIEEMNSRGAGYTERHGQLQGGRE